MISRALTIVFCVVAYAGLATAQETEKHQLIVPLAEGGFIAFKSETSLIDRTKGSTELERGTFVPSSRAVMDDNRIIHRVLEDTGGHLIFGYDLLVDSNPTAKQFRIEVRPLDRKFEGKLRAQKSNGASAARTDLVSTFPKSTGPQTLDDGDAFSLDLLVNQSTGVKIVDVVKVTFNRSNLRDSNPRSIPRDFSLDAVELAMKDYRLLIDGSVISASKSANGCTGAILWFYVQDQGRFIFSLVPRPGYEFQKAGIIDENMIEFTVNGKRYEWLSSSPILPGGGTWNLWVLHDPTYAPIYGSDPPLPQKKGLWAKVENVMSVNQNSTGLGNQKPNTLQVGAPAEKDRTAPTLKRPRVMFGGADRIENLWPKDP